MAVMTDEQQQRLDHSQGWFTHYWQATIDDWLLLDAERCQWVGMVTLRDGKPYLVIADNDVQSFVLLEKPAQQYLHIFLNQNKEPH